MSYVIEGKYIKGFYLFVNTANATLQSQMTLAITSDYLNITTAPTITVPAAGAHVYLPVAVTIATRVCVDVFAEDLTALPAGINMTATLGNATQI